MQPLNTGELQEAEAALLALAQYIADYDPLLDTPRTNPAVQVCCLARALFSCVPLSECVGFSGLCSVCGGCDC